MKAMVYRNEQILQSPLNIIVITCFFSLQASSGDCVTDSSRALPPLQNSR